MREEIKKIAYELYEKRGRGDGYDLDDWLKAEEIVIERNNSISQGKSANDKKSQKRKKRDKS